MSSAKCAWTRKKNSLCFSVDFSKLNAVTKRDYYPIPRMAELVDFLG